MWVVFHLPLVKTAFLRFNSRPLDREPMGILVQGFEKVEIVLKAPVVITSGPGFGRRERLPIGVAIAALDLVGGSCRAPKKPFRKILFCHFFLQNARPFLRPSIFLYSNKIWR